MAELKQNRRERIALQVRLAMQDEMLAPDTERVARRHVRANEAADAILSELSNEGIEP